MVECFGIELQTVAVELGGVLVHDGTPEHYADAFRADQIVHSRAQVAPFEESRTVAMPHLAPEADEIANSVAFAELLEDYLVPGRMPTDNDYSWELDLENESTWPCLPLPTKAGEPVDCAPIRSASGLVSANLFFYFFRPFAYRPRDPAIAPGDADSNKFPTEEETD